MQVRDFQRLDQVLLTDLYCEFWNTSVCIRINEAWTRAGSCTYIKKRTTMPQRETTPYISQMNNYYLLSVTYTHARTQPVVGIVGGLIALAFKARSVELPRWYLILVLAGVLLALPARGLTVRYRERISAMCCKVRIDLAVMGE